MLNKDKIKDLTGRVIKRYDTEIVDVKLNAHATKVASSLENGHLSKEDKSKLDGIQSRAEVNQNAFTTIKVGSKNVVADSKQDTLSINAGANVNITVDEDTDEINISAVNTVYVHPGSGTNPHGTTKADVGLGNVTNESKATMFTNAALTGTPTAPTATKGTNTTQIATTAFVSEAIKSVAAQGHKHNSSDITAMSSYVKQTEFAAISTTDSLNVAIGKLEKGLDTKSNTHSHPYKSENWLPTWNDIQSKPSLETPASAQEKANKALADAKVYTNEKVAALVSTAPEALDTLSELSQALGNDPNFATTVATQIGTKADSATVNAELAKKANTGHKHNSSEITAMTSYAKPSATSAITTSDTLNAAIGKLEKALDNKSNNGHTHTWANITDRPTSLPANGGNADTVDGKHVDDTKTDTTSLWTASKINTELSKKSATNHTHTTTQISMSGYTLPTTSGDIAATDTLNAAIGKLEKGLKTHTHNYRAGDWVPTFSQITSKPTTLSGYGITDAASKTETNNRLTALENELNYTITDSDIDDIIAFIQS